MSKSQTTKSPPPDPEAELLANGATGLAAGFTPRHDPREAIRAVNTMMKLRTLDLAGLAQLSPDERKFAELVIADFDRAGITTAYLTPMVTLAGRIEVLLAASPEDRRKIAVISDGDKATCVRVGKKVARAKKAVAAGARAIFQADAAESFGRGVTFRHDTPADVADALAQLLEGVRKYPEIAARVGIGAAKVKAFEADQAELEAILHRKTVRDGGKTAGGDAIKLEALALESGLDDYRGKVTWELEDDAAQGRLLGLLPRAPERRKKAAPADAPAKDAATEKKDVAAAKSDEAAPKPEDAVAKKDEAPAETAAAK